MDIAEASAGDASPPRPSLAQASRVWLRIGLLSFGGPAAQIALMHREIVEARHWLSEKQYLNALSFCMLLPGPEAMQLATYAGWRLHGTAGGLVAGLLFVLPGAAVILALASVYAFYGQVPLVAALFVGVKAAVVIVVIEALLRVAKRTLHAPEHWVVAGLAFVAIFFLALPFPLIILAAAVYGFVRARADRDEPRSEPVRLAAGNTVATILLWLALWSAPLLALYAFAPDSLLLEIGVFFSKLAVVTFGGAYAVLAYLGQAAVQQYGWLGAGEMMDGLGLAETTPGPLILVNEFVGFIAAYRDGGYWLGVLGAAMTLWTTFVPCFLWIFVGAPYIDWIGSQYRLRGALTAITAAVVGVILNLSLWFALHVFFDEVTRESLGPLVVWIPTAASIDWQVILLAAACAWLLLRRHWDIFRVLGLAALAGLGLSLVG